jgi:hypothetical protein
VTRLAVGLAALTVTAAAASAPAFDGRPDARFAGSRHGWTAVNATDTGTGERAWRVVLDRPDPQLRSRTTWFRASRVPTLYVRARWASADPVARVYWSLGGPFSHRRSRPFFPVADGHFRTYAVRLAGLPGYAGAITRIRVDPVESPQPGDFVDVACISWRRCRPDVAAEERLEKTLPSPRFVDPMGGAPSKLFWQVEPDGLVSACRIGGSFDVQVSYAGRAQLSIGGLYGLSSNAQAASGALRLMRAGNKADIWMRTSDRPDWFAVARGRDDPGRPELVHVTGTVTDFRIDRGEFFC